MCFDNKWQMQISLASKPIVVLFMLLIVLRVYDIVDEMVLMLYRVGVY